MYLVCIIPVGMISRYVEPVSSTINNMLTLLVPQSRSGDKLTWKLTGLPAKRDCSSNGTWWWPWVGRQACLLRGAHFSPWYISLVQSRSERAERRVRGSDTTRYLVPGTILLMRYNLRLEWHIRNRHHRRCHLPLAFLFSSCLSSKICVCMFFTWWVDAVINPFRTAVSFRGQLRTNYLEFDWCVPETGLEF